tara:strand:+ start:179 stop:595 length:417 start_codon:yes stop_codon:yes gene_type:complete
MYKIYKIVDNTNNNVYIGQTKQKLLSNRISCHRKYIKDNRYCSSSIILKNNNWYYEIIEETDDIKREAYWIRNTENCINKNKIMNDEEKKKYNQEYKKNHREENNLNQNRRRIFKNSWGGDPRYHNNLLLINVETIFN